MASTTINIKIDPVEKKKIEEAAKRFGMSVSEIMKGSTKMVMEMDPLACKIVDEWKRTSGLSTSLILSNVVLVYKGGANWWNSNLSANTRDQDRLHRTVDSLRSSKRPTAKALRDIADKVDEFISSVEIQDYYPALFYFEGDKPVTGKQLFDHASEGDLQLAMNEEQQIYQEIDYRVKYEGMTGEDLYQLIESLAKSHGVSFETIQGRDHFPSIYETFSEALTEVEDHPKYWKKRAAKEKQRKRDEEKNKAEVGSMSETFEQAGLTMKMGEGFFYIVQERK